MKVPIALRIFLIGIVVLLVTAIPILFKNNAYASNILFQDNFESSNINNWTPIAIRGSGSWQFANKNGSMMYGSRIERGSVILDNVGPELGTSNYQLDFDYLPIVNGTITKTTDRNLDFGWTCSTPDMSCNPYEVHFLGGNSFWTNFGYPDSTSPTPLLDNQINHITIILNNQHLQFILNGKK